MPDLNFQVEGAEAVAHAAAPLIAFKLLVTNADEGERIQTVALRCQIQIEATRRRYNDEEQKRLLDLYGEPERWGQTLRTMLWTHASVIVRPFEGSTHVELPVPCTFDFNVAAAKYFAGLETGEVPLCLLFSGTVFYEAPDGALQVSQISWEKEAKYRLPVRVWQEMMDFYYPNSVWLSLRRDVFDRLNLFKMRSGIPTWEQALESLLRDEGGTMNAERAVRKDERETLNGRTRDAEPEEQAPDSSRIVHSS
ncbi:MAG: hypothetical protein QOH51_514 [Acidobacteriota bacterium]|nr:hypothetical protein [Acidobacteriota bacterium]